MAATGGKKWAKRPRHVMWQDRLLPCAVFTATSEGFAPYYLAGIRHDLRQTTVVDREVTLGKKPHEGPGGGRAAGEWPGRKKQAGSASAKERRGTHRHTPLHSPGVGRYADGVCAGHRDGTLTGRTPSRRSRKSCR